MKVTTVLTRALLLPFMALTLSGQLGDVVVTSAASFEFGLSYYGSIAAIFCRGLTGITETIQAAGFPLPRELGGVRVTIGGVPAPILAVAPVEGYYQINVQVPWEARFGPDGAWPFVSNSRISMRLPTQRCGAHRAIFFVGRETIRRALVIWAYFSTSTITR